jgi:hypothetical protein
MFACAGARAESSGAVVDGERSNRPSVIRGLRRPTATDHATIARFVVRHEAPLTELFGEVLKLCEKAGLVKPGLGRDRRHSSGGERQS